MRADLFLSENNYFDSRNKAKEAIFRKEVIIDGKIIDKVSFNIAENKNHTVEIKAKKSFVSLGGYKIDKAIEDFNLSVEGFVCADIGASTGGFTDCLIQNCAKKVFAVDLNDGLLHQKLKDDDRVELIVKNARNLVLDDFALENANSLDLIVADLSFISETVVLPVFSNLLKEGKLLLVLIKPQFETDAKIKFKNGIIREEKYRLEAIKKIYDAGISYNLAPIKFTSAPKVEGKNQEYLMLFEKGGKSFLDINSISY